MAEGWVLVIGLAALFLAISLAAFVLRGRRGSPAAGDGLLALGPALVVLGIVFGEEPLLGYVLIAAGVVVAVAGVALRRSEVVR